MRICVTIATLILLVAWSLIAILWLRQHEQPKEDAPALSPDAKLVHDAVCGQKPVIRRIPFDVLDELVVPESLVALYREQPRVTLDLLLAHIEKDKPEASVLAVSYALSLLDGPPGCTVCVEYFDSKTYDQFDRDWETTPRNHWIGKARQRIAQKWPEKP